MKMRYLLLFTTAIGACAALLLSADMYRRMQDAQSLSELNNLPLRQDSVLVFGMQHTVGLISLAFLFLALFLLLIMALRDAAVVAALERQKLPHARPASPEVPPLMTSTPIAAVAALHAELQHAEVAADAAPEISPVQDAQAEAREIQVALASAPIPVEPIKPAPVLAFEVPNTTPQPPAPPPSPSPPVPPKESAS